MPKERRHRLSQEWTQPRHGGSQRAGPKRPPDRIGIAEDERRVQEGDDAFRHGNGFGKPAAELGKSVRVAAGRPISSRAAAIRNGFLPNTRRRRARIRDRTRNGQNHPTPIRERVRPADSMAKFGHSACSSAAITSCTKQRRIRASCSLPVCSQEGVERGLKPQSPSKGFTRARLAHLSAINLANDRFATVSRPARSISSATAYNVYRQFRCPLHPATPKTRSVKNESVAASVLPATAISRRAFTRNIKANFLMSPPLVPSRSRSRAAWT